MYNILTDKPVENNYIYAPRILNLKCFLDYRETKDYLYDLLDITKAYTGLETLPKTYKEAKVIFEKYLPQLSSYANTNLQQYLKYINSLNIQGSRLASIDMTTGAYTSLYFLKKIFGEKLYLGFYSCAFSYNTSLPAEIYATSLFTEKEVPLVNLTEFLITAPELPLTDIKNCKPIYKTPNQYDLYKIQVYKYVLTGIIEFAEDYTQFFLNKPICFSPNTIFNLLKEFLKTATIQDRQYLRKIYHASDSQSSKYLILSPNTRFSFREVKKFINKQIVKLKRQIKYLLYTHFSLKQIEGILKICKRIRSTIH